MKAIALISGGLDSLLAARLIKEQGIEVIPLNFQIPFCNNKKPSFNTQDKLSLITGNLGVGLKTVDISNEFLSLLKKPKHGFGANMNPCIDCKILMLNKTRELMQPWGAAFVVTGEVLGQRPMSQHRQALETIEKESELEGLLLRPLSAKLLPSTIPEKQGWVDRNRLLDFSGRTRRPQIKLAKGFHIENYPNASGGCLLTDPEFSKRLKELIQRQELNLSNIELLKIGRHFRLREDTKLIVGRNEKENELLFELAKESDYLFMPPEETAGPTSLGRGIFDAGLIQLASSITSRYCDTNGNTDINILYKQVPEKEERLLEVSPIEEKKLIKLRI
ncbi:MAG: tRNA 4-thiouridine(8) synthase ThiI [Candidatus Omnitrophica bacterium]|nr:tRNA 4-thiouridine(8) synthase ThiI [Candidatus Omnitrophota bacterium]